MRSSKKYLFFLGVLVLILVTLACGQTAPASQIKPTTTNPADQMHYSVQDLYNEAQQIATDIVTSRMQTRAWLWGIGLFLGVVAVGIMLGIEGAGWWSFAILVAIACGALGGYINTSQISGKVDSVGHQLANQAITSGVDLAQRAQATNYQYIHAVISQIGMDVQPCQQTVNYRDFCSSNTSYYTHREINSHQVCVTTTDSDGDTTISCHEEHDDEYTPWFDQVVRYWFVPDTRAKYLSEQIYHQQCLADDGSFATCSKDEYGNINDKRKPVVYAETDWRAPENAQAHIYCENGFFGKWCERPGDFNSHVPDAWKAAKVAKESGGPVVDATFVGPYFSWGFAADSPLYDVYTGHYDDLRSFVSLPGAGDVSFNITNAYGKPDVLKTQLIATDGDIAIGFNPIFTIGDCVKPEQLEGYADYAMQVQGDFGPTKQGSLRWFLICDSIVTQLGGMPNAVSAVKAYLRDTNVWGLFSMPKNLVISVTSVSDDGTRITDRALETGMPAGNVVVIKKVGESVPSGTTLSLTKENLFGTFTANYVPAQANKFEYKFSDLTQAGSVVGLLYEKDPNYTPPDPSSPDCESAKADHVGFVRYSTCNTDYLRTTIQVNEDGRFLIMNVVTQGATAATPLWGGWLALGLAIAFLLLVIFGKAENG